MQGTGRPFSEESDLKNLKIMTFGVSPTRRDRSHCPRIVVLICDDLAPREQLMMSRHSFDCHDWRGVAGISLRRGQGYWWASYNIRVSPSTHRYSAIPISLVFSLSLSITVRQPKITRQCSRTSNRKQTKHKLTKAVWRKQVSWSKNKQKNLSGTSGWIVFDPDLTLFATYNCLHVRKFP